MCSATYMPRTVRGPDEAETFTVVYDYVPTGYRLDRSGRLTPPTGAAPTGTWKAYRQRPDGTLEIVRGKGIRKDEIIEAIEAARALAA